MTNPWKTNLPYALCHCPSGKEWRTKTYSRRQFLENGFATPFQHMSLLTCHSRAQPMFVWGFLRKAGQKQAPPPTPLGLGLDTPETCD
ncbi:hypothetical protein DNTS_006576 [Danionella cerebrum]|uniref:Uncharacterized protein n=1 Tax=Danionella cerebrum TaxID=2873325 RepID=A0A553NAC6_9TELE|nr:hypothetical protein DNTS_006576 [Danionella translucida]